MPIHNPYEQKLSSIPVRTYSVRAGKVETQLWDYGPPQSPISLIMVHGFRGDHHGLEPIVAELGSDIRILIPDLPGFGLSEALPSPADISAYAQWLKEFLTAVEAPRDVVVLGHSFGSIVVSASLDEGLAVHRAILINPIAANALQGPRGFMTRLAVLYYKAAAALPPKAGFALLKNKMIVRIMSETMAKTKDKELRAWIHDQHDQYFSLFASRDAVLEAFETSVKNDVSQFSNRLSQDILLIAADKDDITALPAQKLLAEKIPHAELEVIEGVGHLIHYEAPDLAAKYIRTFLGLPSTRVNS